MQVRLNDGQVITIDDNATEDEVREAINSASLPKPSMLGYAAGALGTGLKDLLVDKIPNIEELFGETEAAKRHRTPTPLTTSPTMKAYEKWQPTLPWYGGLATGALEFVPQLPLYYAIGKGAMTGLGMLPKVGKFIKPLMAATKGERFLPGYAKAIGRGVIEGGATGLVAGSPGGTPFGERLAEAGREAKDFATAIGVLHPAGKVLGAVGRRALRKMRKMRGGTDVDISTTNNLEVVDEPLVIEPEGEEVGAVIPTISTRDTKRLQRLGWSAEDFAGKEKGDVVRVLKKGIIKPAETGFVGDMQLSLEDVPDKLLQKVGALGKKAENGLIPITHFTKEERLLLSKKALVSEYKPTEEELAELKDVGLKGKSFIGVDPTRLSEEIRRRARPPLGVPVGEAQDKLTPLPASKTAPEGIGEKGVKGLLPEPYKERVEALPPAQGFELVGEPQDFSAGERDFKSEDYLNKLREGKDVTDETISLFNESEIKKEAAVRPIMELFKERLRAKAEVSKWDMSQNDYEKILESEGMSSKIGEESFEELREGELSGVEESPDMLAHGGDLGDGSFTLGSLGGQQVYEKVVTYLKRAAEPSKGAKLIAEANDKELLANRFKLFDKGDISPLRGLLTTRGWAKQDVSGIAPRLLTKLQGALSASSFKTNEHMSLINSIMSKLTPEEQEISGKYLRGKAGETPALKAAYGEIRKFNEMMWGKEMESRLAMFKRNLSEDENNALLDLISGESIESVTDKYNKRMKIGKDGKQRTGEWIDPVVLKDIKNNFDAIIQEKDKIPDYISNYEKGRFKIFINKQTKEGKSKPQLIAVGLSRLDTERKVLKYIKSHPEFRDKVYCDTNFFDVDNLATSVSKKQLGIIQSRLARTMQKELDEINSNLANSLAKRGTNKVFQIKPSKPFTPYLLERDNLLEGEDNIFPILRHYAYKMERHWALDPIIDDVRRDIGNIPSKAIRERLLETVEDVKGKYYFEDKAADWLLKSITDRANKELGTNFDSPKEMAASRLVAKAKTIQALEKFMYRPISGIMNFLSGQGHTWSVVGEKYFKDAWKDYTNITPETKAFLDKVRPFLGQTYIDESAGRDIGRGLLERSGIIKMGENKWSNMVKRFSLEPLGAFTLPELANRDIAALAFRKMRLEMDPKISEEALMEYVGEQVRFTQFSYDMATLGTAFRRPTGRLLLQFKSYLVQEMSFIGSLNAKQLLRYTAMQLALGGPRGLLIMAKSFPFLAALTGPKVWEDIEEYANTYMPRISRGVGGFLGVDVSAPATFQFPVTGSDWLGPTATDVMRIGDLYKSFVSGENLQGSDVFEAVSGGIPIIKYWQKMFDQVVNKDGWVRDVKGKKMFHIDTPMDAASYFAKSVIGAEDIRSSQIKVADRILAERNRREDRIKSRLTGQFLDAMQSGKSIPKDVMEGMAKHGISRESILRNYKLREVDPMTRQLLLADMLQRGDVMRDYPKIQ